jgi:hypothetical protein
MSKLRDKRLKKLYGLNPGEYERILEFQGNACAICKRPPREGKSLHVDHSHKTGVTRGLICWPDNRALGFFRDSLERLEAATAYLKDPPALTALGGERMGYQKDRSEAIRKAKALLREDAEWRTEQERLARQADILNATKAEQESTARRAAREAVAALPIQECVAGRGQVTTREVLKSLEVEHTKANTMFVASRLRDLGWTKRRVTLADGRQGNTFFPPEEPCEA